MAANYPTPQDDTSRYWDMLKLHLAHRDLKCADGSTRFATVDEFMLMHVDQRGAVGFKHRCTRNYVFLEPNTDFEGGYSLYVPRTNEYFMRGTFDNF